jgi:hypothetical protein
LGRKRGGNVDSYSISIKLPQLAILRPAPLRKRLWQGGVAMFTVLAIFVAGNFVIAPQDAVSSRMLGHDFLAFYTAGTFTRLGQLDRLYNLDATREMEHSLATQNKLEVGKGFGPFWNPPFYAALLAPLTALPYTKALVLWTIANLVCLMVALVLLVRMLPALVARPPKGISFIHEPLPLKFKRDWRNWALVPLLLCTSMPFVQAISHGQNTFCSLMLLTLVVTTWRNRMPLAAGIACGLMFYKPQLAAVVAAMLVLSMGLRVVLGLGLVGAALLLITTLAMPGSLDNYIYQLPLNLKFMQVDHTYLWERHVTLKAFWRLLFQGREAGATTGFVNLLTISSCTVVAMGLLVAWWRTRRCKIDDVWTGETSTAMRDRFIGATITATPLLMPFYFDYDLLLLSVPAVLFAGEILAQAPGTRLDRMQRMLVGAWGALYFWLLVNPPIAGRIHVNLSVILLSMVAGLSMIRAIRRGVRTSSFNLPQIQHVTVKRAA